MTTPYYYFGGNMLRMTINIELDERVALIELARQQHRDFRQQAALLVRERLQQLKMLPPTTPILPQRGCHSIFTASPGKPSHPQDDP